MPLTPPSHWVDKRAHADAALAKTAPDSWNKIGSEIQIACEHFRDAYKNGPLSATWEHKNSHGIVVSVTGPVARIDVTFSFHQDIPAVDVTAGSQQKTRYILKWDNNQVVLQAPNGEAVSEERLVQDALEPLFFPTTPKP
jgi:hypothetical protein